MFCMSPISLLHLQYSNGRYLQFCIFQFMGQYLFFDLCDGIKLRHIQIWCLENKTIVNPIVNAITIFSAGMVETDPEGALAGFDQVVKMESEKAEW